MKSPQRHTLSTFSSGPKPSTKEEGLSLVEVIVSLLISVIIITVGLQMFIAASFLRVRAVQFGDAYNWIENDFEQVRNKATVFEQNAFPFSPFCNGDPDNNLAANFIADTAAGLGGNLVNLGTQTFSGQAFELIRRAEHDNTSRPDRLVSLQYSLLPEQGGDAEIEIVTEVVIYAAFQCP